MPHPDKTYPGVVSPLDVLNEETLETANAGQLKLYGLTASGTGANVIIKPTGLMDSNGDLRNLTADLSTGELLRVKDDDEMEGLALPLTADLGGTGIDATGGGDALAGDQILRYNTATDKFVSDANYILDSANENLGLGSGVTLGSGATRTISLLTGVEPGTGPADTVQLSSVESVSGGTILGIRTDGGIALQTGQPDAVSTRRVRIKIDGVEVSLLAE